MAKLYRVFCFMDESEEFDYRMIAADSEEAAEEIAVVNSDWDCASATEIKSIDGYKIILEKMED